MESRKADDVTVTDMITEGSSATTSPTTARVDPARVALQPNRNCR